MGGYPVAPSTVRTKFPGRVIEASRPGISFFRGPPDARRGQPQSWCTVVTRIAPRHSMVPRAPTQTPLAPPIDAGPVR